ncbi:hypothetical protein FRC11_014894 [Ceratobasidium sp. 423]|nr:hypothetical protein FRC11_014894 [Ceratobasidium sp. 423]
MGRVKREEGLAEIPRPCDYFDVIGGTSREEAAIKKIVRGHSENKDADTRLFDPLLQPNSRSQSRGCRVLSVHYLVITWKPASPLISEPTKVSGSRLPTVRYRKQPEPQVQPTFFKPITIDDGGIPRKFIDGGMSVNNPTERVLAEAKDLFPEENISCILSIGTGQAKTISMSKTNAAANVIVPDYQLANVVKKIATDCEKMADKMAARFAPHPGVYFRFSVDQGM